MNRVTLADGRPAYERGVPRLRQSHVDLDRRIKARAKQGVAADLRDLDRDRRALGEPGAGAGTLIVCCGTSALFVLLVAAFAIFS